MSLNTTYSARYIFCDPPDSHLLMGKTLCDWKKKDRLKHADKYEALTRDPEYMCAKCGRCAVSKKVLCKARLAFVKGAKAA